MFILKVGIGRRGNDNAGSLGEGSQTRAVTMPSAYETRFVDCRDDQMSILDVKRLLRTWIEENPQMLADNLQTMPRRQCQVERRAKECGARSFGVN